MSLLIPFVDLYCVYAFRVTKTSFNVALILVSTTRGEKVYTLHKFMYIQRQIIKPLHQIAYVLGKATSDFPFGVDERAERE